MVYEWLSYKVTVKPVFDICWTLHYYQPNIEISEQSDNRPNNQQQNRPPESRHYLHSICYNTAQLISEGHHDTSLKTTFSSSYNVWSEVEGIYYKFYINQLKSDKRAKSLTSLEGNSPLRGKSSDFCWLRVRDWNKSRYTWPWPG